MLEYPHPAVHLLEVPLLGDQQDLRTFLHLLDAALNYWNGHPGNSKTITLHSSIHPCCDSYSPFLHRFACLNWDPNRSAIGQDPWHYLVFSVFVRSSVDPLSLDLVWIELDNLIYLLQIIYFVRLRDMAMLVDHPQDFQKKRERIRKKRGKYCLETWDIMRVHPMR